MPLDVMLARMRDEALPNGAKVTDQQFEAAVAAAPYLHQKLTATTISGGLTVSPAEQLAVAEARRRLVADLDALARPEPLTIDHSPAVM